MDPAVRSTHKGLLYVADENEQDVRIYMQGGHHQHPVGEITSGLGLTMAVFVDTKRNLWVGNWTGSAGQILRYPQGSTTPDRTLNDSTGYPGALWVARDGTVYAVNGVYSGATWIAKYPPGSEQPQVISDPNIPLLTSVVGDGKGAIYAGGLPNGGYGEIDELPAGQTTWQNTGMVTNTPSALAFDANGDLLVSAEEFLTFRIGHKRPINSVPCNVSDCGQVAFDHSGKHLWAIESADYTGPVLEFNYPSGKRINDLHQPQTSAPDGVAAAPALYP
jgi:hypothetical protein